MLHMSNLSEINVNQEGPAGPNSRNLFDSIGSLVNSNVYKATPYKRLKLEELPINHTIMGIANAVCEEHQQDKKLYCVDDGCSVCEKCAIFGMHRGHEIVATDGLEQSVTLIKKELQKDSHYLYGNTQTSQSSEERQRGFQTRVLPSSLLPFASSSSIEA